MKVLGRILLLIAGILFIICGVLTIIGAASQEMTTNNIIAIVFAALCILGGIGAIFYFIGVGPFKGLVPVIAIVLLVLWVINAVVQTIDFIQNGGAVWDYLHSLVYLAVPEALYLSGWLLARNK